MERPQKSYGAELFGDLNTIWYDLLLNRDQFSTKMYQTDIFDIEEPLKELEGKMDIVYVGLLDCEGQIKL
ncbi:hypothetical protein V1507DRAFT_465944 [Lipomyces tetrasporus]